MRAIDLSPGDVCALRRLCAAGPLDEFDDAFGIRVPGLKGYQEFSSLVSKRAVQRLAARGLAVVGGYVQHAGGPVVYRAVPTRKGVEAIKQFGPIRDGAQG